MKTDTSKSTVLVITVGFIALYLFLSQEWAIYAALIIGFIGALSSWMSIKIEWLWFKLAYVLSKIVPTVLLTAIFYLFLFPLSLISRLYTKDPLILKNIKNTTFIDVAKIDVKKSMEKTW